jgi:hypothetical protein
MKTVLAPNAPWPAAKPAPVKRPVAKRITRAKPSKVDDNFGEWLKRQGISMEKLQ